MSDLALTFEVLQLYSLPSEIVCYNWPREYPSGEFLRLSAWLYLERTIVQRCRRLKKICSVFLATFRQLCVSATIDLANKYPARILTFEVSYLQSTLRINILQGFWRLKFRSSILAIFRFVSATIDLVCLYPCLLFGVAQLVGYLRTWRWFLYPCFTFWSCAAGRLPPDMMLVSIPVSYFLELRS